MTVSTTNFNAALKVLYPNGLENTMYQASPFLAWLPKTTDFGGEVKTINPWIGGVNGSNDFEKARANVSTPTIKKFKVDRRKGYTIAFIENEVMMATKSNAHSVAQALKTTTESCLYEHGRSLAQQVLGNSGGARGQIDINGGAQPLSGTVINLAQRLDVTKFEVGMKLQLSSDDGTGGAGVRTGTLTVTAIDRSLGRITVDAAISSVTSAADGDYIFRDGDYGNCMAGVFAWIPPTAPTSGDNFFGVDRSVDVSRLAGVRFDVSSLGAEQAVFEAHAEGEIHGVRGQDRVLWIGPKRFSTLQDSQDSKAWITVPSSNPKIGLRGLQIMTPYGVATVMTDPMWPNEYGLLTTAKAWELSTLGKCPHWAKTRGEVLHQLEGADAHEIRAKHYGNLICHRPVDNILLQY